MLEGNFPAMVWLLPRKHHHHHSAPPPSSQLQIRKYLLKETCSVLHSQCVSTRPSVSTIPVHPPLTVFYTLYPHSFYVILYLFKYYPLYTVFYSYYSFSFSQFSWRMVWRSCWCNHMSIALLCLLLDVCYLFESLDLSHFFQHTHRHSLGSRNEQQENQ